MFILILIYIIYLKNNTMPDGVIFADSNDNALFKFSASGWASVRDASSATFTVGANNQQIQIGQANAFPNRGGGVRHFIYRGFFYFDTSDVTGTLSDATLFFRRDLNIETNPSLIIVKSTAFGGDGQSALDVDDWQEISGWQNNTSLASSATNYSGVITSLSPNSNVNITLTAAALADIKNNDAFIICAMQYSKDYLNVDPTASASAPQQNDNRVVQSANNPTVAFRPQLIYNLAPTGYGNDVSGVASANIGKVDGVATANIEKIIGV